MEHHRATRFDLAAWVLAALVLVLVLLLDLRALAFAGAASAFPSAFAGAALALLRRDFGSGFSVAFLRERRRGLATCDRITNRSFPISRLPTRQRATGRVRDSIRPLSPGPNLPGGLLVESVTRGELPLPHGRVWRLWAPSSSINSSATSFSGLAPM